MFRPSSLFLLASSALLLAGVSASGQGAAPAQAHHRAIVVRLVTTAGGITPFAFEPANIVAQPGDTVRFVDGADMMHNVHFTRVPSGAHLGSAAVGPYLTNTGQTYAIVIDSRFAPGRYEFVCDPHATLGMRGTLTVQP